MKRNHTPTPWKVSHKNGVTCILKDNREVIHWLGFDSSHYPKEVLSNARFIVLAVNSHDLLVKALKDLADELGFIEWSSPEEAEEILLRLTSEFPQIIKILTKAGVKP